MRTAFGIVHRQPGRHGLHGVDAEIGRSRLGAFPGEARAGRDREPLDQRHDDVGGDIGDRAGISAHALAQFTAQAQPVDREIFDEPAELVCGLDVAKAGQLGIFIAPARRDVFERGAGAKISDVEQRDTGAVAGPAKLVDRSGTANGEDRDRHELPVLRSDEIRRVLSADADHDGPVAGR
ncbi:hypothetical protein ACVW0J_004481 [Bradyrhizobium sp. i1.7.7]